MTELVLLVDLDGVLADFEKRRYDILTERGLPTVHPSRVWDFYGTGAYTKAHGKEAARAARAVTVEPGFFESMELIPGGFAGVEHLAGMHDVRICSKPLDEHPNCTAEKLYWIRKNLGDWWADRAHIIKKKSLVNADALIDDRPDLRTYTLKRGEPEPVWEHVLFEQRWNRDSTSHDYEMRDWTDFRWLERMVEKAELRKAGL